MMNVVIWSWSCEGEDWIEAHHSNALSCSMSTTTSTHRRGPSSKFWHPVLLWLWPFLIFERICHFESTSGLWNKAWENTPPRFFSIAIFPYELTLSESWGHLFQWEHDVPFNRLSTWGQIGVCCEHFGACFVFWTDANQKYLICGWMVEWLRSNQGWDRPTYRLPPNKWSSDRGVEWGALRQLQAQTSQIVRIKNQ